MSRYLATETRDKKDKRRSKRWFKRKYSSSRKVNTHGCMYSKSQAERASAIAETGFGILPLEYRKMRRRNGGAWGRVSFRLLEKWKTA
tara:strand:- start:19289 stop:19552 length:264 start_codon:yes stop_codon:yes gene_type:complete